MARSIIRLVLYFVAITACSPSGRSHDAVFNSTTKSPVEDVDTISATDYYSSTYGLIGATLKQALHEKIKVALRLPYARIIYDLQYTDADPNQPANLIMIYSGRSLPAENTSTDPEDSWNREHVWAKSHGFPRTNMPAHTDLHHVRPCEIALNRQRGDFMFTELTDGEHVTKLTSALRDAYQGVFSPPPEVRGDIARMLLYMDVRYEGDDPREPDLRLVEKLPQDVERGVDSKGAGYHNHLSTLLKWHKDDPVDAFERRRNERVFDRQKNRNPFIDHPEFADLIYRPDALPQN